ncbi:glycosyltransferase [Kineococcus sp. R8]|uniref:glycosyltransferase family 2 protein n=1 Tax=Kineococcus siccus TaxID=2696567 RepID=UPI0014123C32|nr:glycosyltransferase [Kineococcus siccus]NAZ83636.1 glycosyltransferase [Kineococcus siccus]
MQTTGSPLSPRVSVIMPVRDGAQFLAEAMTSILTQTETDLELLVVDDGSTDDSAAIASSTGDPRVRVLSGNGKGEGAARNIGLDNARGRWIAWHDADDVAVPHRLSSLLAAVAGGADFAHSDMVFVDAAGATTGYLRSSAIPREHVLPFFLREGTPFNNPTMLIRGALVSELRFEESLVVGVDTDFVRRFAPYSTGVHVPQPLTLYRRHEGSISLGAGPDVLYPHVAHFLDTEPLTALVPEAFREYPGTDADAVAAAVVGLSLFRRGFPHAAVQWIELALTRSTPACEPVVGAVVALASGNASEVVRTLRSCRETALTTCLVGDALARAGDLPAASTSYLRALAIDPLSYDAVAGLRATGGRLGLRVVDDPRRRLLGVGEA